MRLSFKENAIVQLGIAGFARPEYVTGRVEKVTAYEVVIVQQGRLDNENEKKLLAVDIDERMHIDRDLIFSWKYASFDQLLEVLPVEITQYARITEMDSRTRLYTGEGKTFEEIPEEEEIPEDIPEDTENFLDEDDGDEDVSLIETINKESEHSEVDDKFEDFLNQFE